jgi:hypothetical protein
VVCCTSNTADDPPTNFMVLTRATNVPGPDGVRGDDPATPQDETVDDIQDATNATTPFVDQKQTYASHPSHQVFLRQYGESAFGWKRRRAVTTGSSYGTIAFRRVKLPHNQSLEASLDILNTLNINTITTQTNRSGSTYLQPTAIIAPRVRRLGVRSRC